ncbi:MAG: hypothetical protein AUH69_04430 [Actinobacteria bacterium 13_1_40CM_4_65_12]|nr:MAG: hypothetical protein AUH69_04430 [Actinobacteria bacterium 13_1_40CM_4_65_12]
MQQAAADLLAAGVAVRGLTLPGLAEHDDVSEWLDLGHTAAELVALADQAPPFDADPAGALIAAEPELCREGLDLALVWPNGVRFALTAIRDGHDGVRGELTILHGPRRLSWGLCSLSSPAARETLRKKLDATAPDLPWGDYLEEATWTLKQAARQGEPLVTLTGQVRSPTRELLPRFLYEGEPTLLYADGDTGKSLVALALAVAVHSGAALPFGLKAVRAVPAAYLDWETSRDTLDPDISDATAIAFTCTKANNLPRKPEPFGLRFVPGDGTITVYPFDLAEAAPQTVVGAGLPYRVRLALATGSRTIAELAEHLTVPEETVGRVVRRLASKHAVVKDGDAPGAGGRGHAARWKLGDS